jgi:hypothetical protein
VQQQAVSIIDTTNFTFAPTQPGTYILQAQPVIFSQFPLSFGPLTQVTVNTAPTIVMSPPVLTNSQILLNFNVVNITNITSATFHLLQANVLSAGWITNTTATFTTNIAAGSYRFTTTNNAATRFYRVRTP